jgi:flavin reductase (DIM6/NTAB) family NADH-FMN oxidoreductase RutF
MQIKTSYEEAIGTKYPEQVAIAIVKDNQGKYNPITLGWTMITSHQPPMMAISIGLTRHSLGAIRAAREFVISFPSSSMAEDAMFYGTKSGRDMDKLAEFGAKTQPATVIDGVLLADAVANFECRLESELPTGDHIIFVGRVVASHVNKARDLRRLYTLGENYRMGGVIAVEPPTQNSVGS